MTIEPPSKYGSPLTGSDWAGLPLRIGHAAERGRLEALSTDTDAILVWTGGPSTVQVTYRDPKTGESAHYGFERASGMMDVLPRGTQLLSVEWVGQPSTCTSVNFPATCLTALGASQGAGLDPERGPQFGLIDAHVVDLVHRLQRQAQGKDSLGAVYVQSLSLALASYILARYGEDAQPEPGRKEASLSAPQRHKLEQFVEAELGSDFGLVDLAAIVGYSPDHFSRLFKRSFGTSPHQYVLSRRVERAQSMLRDNSVSIAQIATTCGFASQAHLSTAFKRRTGVTPSAYRKA